MAESVALDLAAALGSRCDLGQARALAACQRARAVHAELSETSARTRRLVAEIRQSRGQRRRAPQMTRVIGDRGEVRLTSRQGEILAALAAGESTAELSARLWLAPTTVRNHVAAILRALGAHSRLEAVAIARRRGLV